MGYKLPTDWQCYDDERRKEDLIREFFRYNGMLSRRDKQAKYARMSQSPFAFYRGSAHLYYYDLQQMNLPEKSQFHNRSTRTWIQGDLHINNFGAFCDSDGEVVFDLNDFDEAFIAPYLFDVWRGASSLALQGMENDFSESKVRAFIIEFCHEYLNALERYAQWGSGPVHYEQVTAHNTTGPLQKFLLKAETKNSRESMLDDWTIFEDGKRRFSRNHARLAAINPDDHRILTKAISHYKDHLDSPLRGREDYFTVLDIARRLDAGVGSLGTPRYYVLVRGETDDPNEDHILDVKEQGLPSYFPFLPHKDQEALLERFPEEQAGLRVALAQKAMLLDPDPTLGYFAILGRSFSVRERSPFKKTFKLGKLMKKKNFLAMSHHWGTILGAAHARGNDADPDLPPHAFERAVMDLAAGNRTDFYEEVVTFAMSYAEQVALDHRIFVELWEKEVL